MLRRQRCRAVCGTRQRNLSNQQLRGDVLSGVLDLARRSGERQSMLGTQELIETGTEQRPGLGEREVATEIEQGALANASADTLGTDQAIGEVVFAVGGSAGLSAADEHGMSRRYGEQPRRVYSVSTLWHYGRFWQFEGKDPRTRAAITPNASNLASDASRSVKDGLAETGNGGRDESFMSLP